MIDIIFSLLQVNKFKRSLTMSKQKLADLVLQKMKKKKEKQLQNRPHLQVLQLLVKFEVQDYNMLQKQISILQNQIKSQREVKNKLEGFNQQFQNTGKKPYPRIIVKPEFIASENVQAAVKQFYRKSSNTFLREDLLRKKQYDLDIKLVEQIQNKYKQMKEKQNFIAQKLKMQHKTYNQKRVRNLKQRNYKDNILELRLRSIKEAQQRLKQTIASQKKQNQSLLDQYELKKTNLNKRIQWSAQLIPLIQRKKQQILKKYNPVSYRDFLKKIFNIRTKNQSMVKNLQEAQKRITQLANRTTKLTQSLINNHNCFVQGKLPNSPSRRKRHSVSQFHKQKKILPHPNLLYNLKKNAAKQTQLNESTTLKRDKSFSTSLGKTAASSMATLSSSLKKRGFSIEFSETKKSGRKANMFD